LFDHNYPSTPNSIALLQSGLTYLKKEAEVRNCNWEEFVQQIDNNQWSVMGRGGEFKAIVNTQHDTCTCVAKNYCWHKAIVACFIRGSFPHFDYQTTAIVSSKIKDKILYELFIIVDGNQVSVKNFKRELEYWKPIIKKTANRTQLVLKPETQEGKKLLYGPI
jgi:hypothetical protein